MQLSVEKSAISFTNVLRARRLVRASGCTTVVECRVEERGMEFCRKESRTTRTTERGKECDKLYKCLTPRRWGRTSGSTTVECRVDKRKE